MAFDRPTPQQIRDRLAAEFDGLFEGADPRRRRSVEGVLVKVVAMAQHELHSHIAWAARQIHIGSADEDALEERAALWDVLRRAAVAATGSVTFSGTAGVIVPAGTELRRADDTEYVLLADCTIGVGGTGAGSVVASMPGAAGNAAAATTLALIEPVAGVQPSATVGAGGLTGGLEIEDLESLRARTRERLREPPAGGAEADYKAWTKAVVGETRVWVRRATPLPGWVTVLFLLPDGTLPDPATVAAVAAAIETQRPVTATGINVAAPVAQLVDFTIDLSPDTLASRQAVTLALGDLLVREAEPGGTLPRSRIIAGISAADGEYSHVLSVPAGDIVTSAGTIARLGTITWL